MMNRKIAAFKLISGLKWNALTWNLDEIRFKRWQKKREIMLKVSVILSKELRENLIWFAFKWHMLHAIRAVHIRKWCRSTHALLVYVSWEYYFEWLQFRGFMMLNMFYDEFISLSNRNLCGIDILSGKHSMKT